jgi:hypothetical protein
MNDLTNATIAIDYTISDPVQGEDSKRKLGPRYWFRGMKLRLPVISDMLKTTSDTIQKAFEQQNKYKTLQLYITALNELEENTNTEVTFSKKHHVQRTRIKIEGHTPKEIAEMYGMDKMKVYNRIAQGRKTIAKIAEGHIRCS